ncbi:RNA polymerase sigma-70 factor [Pedobacter sp.]|jgi:RNA polymerase sigma-70 factor (family 1)|uniref:RNA polymerase sigma factor n=1 Tax=Pedobacter sp. TaxID=1411316 RepID=UPI002CEC4539|nr:RNA polymerase sigma-70 factor [Pedobacter sp.]HWW41590.1 RNA polymerase sigma-70 factor [Pedobacter sp.]
MLFKDFLTLREYCRCRFVKNFNIETTATLSIPDLVTSLKQGDTLAMENIYRNHWEAVLDSVYKRVRDEEVAQDITQEIFISLWENRERLVIEGSLGAYLQGAVKYKVINYFKSAIVKEKHQDDLTMLVGEQNAASAESQLLLKDLHKEIDEALMELPDKMRLIFSMSRKQEKTIQEISQELNLSAQTVKNQISAALKVVKKRLSYLLILSILILLTQT